VTGHRILPTGPARPARRRLVPRHRPEPFGVLSAFRLYGSAVQDGLDLTHIAALTVAATTLTWIGAVLLDRRDVL